MRVLFISVLWLVFTGHSTFSQESKRNNYWLIGAADSPIKIRFDSLSVKMVDNVISSIPYPMFHRGGSCISNLLGELQFGCNTFYIYDKEGYCIGSQDTVNIPLGNKFYQYYGGVGLWNQASIILPQKTNRYYVITTGMSDTAYNDWKVAQTDFRMDVLSYAIVDMDSNGGQGKVVEKNVILKQNARMSHNRMTAVRHGNGYDWWLIKPHQWKQKFYTFLVTADSITEQPEQDVPFDMSQLTMFTWGTQDGIWGIQGQSAFSPDGNWYASTEFLNYGVYVYHFDRCNGQLTPYHYFPIPDFDTSYQPFLTDGSVGLCFSPDSKLLYLNTSPIIRQIDLTDTSPTTMIRIAEPDTLVNYFPEYYNANLAPDGKIYIGSRHLTLNSMPTIDSPNVRGLGCAFRGRGNGAFSQPFTNIGTPPNMPFYGLGGNGLCIPANTSHIKKAERNFIVYPNPASTEISIKYELMTKEEAVFYLYDLSGKIVTSKKFDASKTQEKIDVSNLSRGLYTYKISVGGGENYNGKITVE